MWKRQALVSTGFKTTTLELYDVDVVGDDDGNDDDDVQLPTVPEEQNR